MLITGESGTGSAGRIETVSVRVLSKEGDSVDVALAVAETEQAELILATPRYKAMAGKSDQPVYIMPGTILVPDDSSDAVTADLPDIIPEAKSSGSTVLLLGIVPVHIYRSAEREELERITGKTAGSVKKNKKDAG